MYSDWVCHFTLARAQAMNADCLTILRKNYALTSPITMFPKFRVQACRQTKTPKIHVQHFNQIPTSPDPTIRARISRLTEKLHYPQVRAPADPAAEQMRSRLKILRKLMPVQSMRPWHATSNQTSSTYQSPAQRAKKQKRC